MTSPGEITLSQLQEALEADTNTTTTADTIHTQFLSSFTSTQIALCITSFLRSHGTDTRTMISAMLLAADLHHSDLRHGELGGTQAYIIHPLRNTLRLIRYGAQNVEILMASVLHDTVEDHPFDLARKAGVETSDEVEARRASLDYIASTYGAGTAVIVRGVSNPIVHKATMSRERWNEIYAHHVEDSTSDPLVFACKVSDFVDNAGVSRPEDESSLERRVRLAKKYFPVCQILLDRLERGVEEGNLPFGETGIALVRQDLMAAQSRLATILTRSS